MTELEEAVEKCLEAERRWLLLWLKVLNHPEVNRD